MKYLVLPLLLVALTIGGLCAQEQDYTYEQVPVKRSPAFGIKGGLNISQIAGPDAFDSSDYGLGFHVGAMLQYNLLKAVYFQPELLYTQKGYSRKDSPQGLDTKTTDSYDYIEMPLLLKLSVNVPSVQIQPYIGPAFSYLVSAKSRITESVSAGSLTHTEDIKSDMRKLDMGISVGADMVVFERIMLGGHYNFGLARIYHSSMSDIGTDVQNGVFMLSLGFLFGR